MSTTPLEQLKADFDAWRQSKTTPQSRIPLPLRQRAAALRAEYSDGEIVRTLKITAPRLLESVADFAEELTTDTTEIPESLAFYIDYEKMGHDLELGGDIFTIETGYREVHIFWNH